MVWRDGNFSKKNADWFVWNDPFITFVAVKGRICILRVALAVLCLAASSAAAIAEPLPDSLRVDRARQELGDDIHDISPVEILLPTAAITASAFFVSNDWAEDQREEIQEMLSADEEDHVTYDNYLQFSPMIAAYGLEIAGIEGRHGLLDKTLLLLMSYGTMAITVYSMKNLFREKRPDSSGRNSFPSGHTATAFMGAELLYREYKDVSPWIGYSGYAVAVVTGYLRIHNNRHYINDVLAGAFIGVLSTKFAYWLYPRLFESAGCNKSVTVSGMPYCSSGSVGVNLHITF